MKLQMVLTSYCALFATLMLLLPNSIVCAATNSSRDVSEQERFSRVLESVQAHRRKQAYELMKQFLADFPDAKTNPDYLVQMGYCANSVRRPKEALDSFNTALRLSPSRHLMVDLLVGKGISFRDLRQQRLARETMKQALALARKENNRIVVNNIRKLLDSKGIAFPLNGTRPQNRWLPISMCTLVAATVAFRIKSFIQKSRTIKREQ